MRNDSGEVEQMEEKAVYVNGIKYAVIYEHDDRDIGIRRPKGKKVYYARRIVSTAYGENRAYIVCGLPGVANPFVSQVAA